MRQFNAELVGCLNAMEACRQQLPAPRDEQQLRDAYKDVGKQGKSLGDDLGKSLVAPTAGEAATDAKLLVTRGVSSLSIK